VTQHEHDRFGLLGEKWSAGGAKFTVGLRAEVGKLFGSATFGLGIATCATCTFYFGAPIDIDEEMALVDELFGRRTSMVAGHITGGDGNEMGRNAKFVANSRNASWSKKVDFNR
jgi:hypothetical protein